MQLRRILLIILSIAFPTSSYSAGLTILCPAALQSFVARLHPEPRSYAQTISRVQDRMRAILGPLYSDGGVRLENRTCIRDPGCGYDWVWNVIQIDHGAVLRDDWAYGVVYAHELSHAIIANQNPLLARKRQEIIEGERLSYLDTWAKIHQTRNAISSAKQYGLSGFARATELEIDELSEKMVDQNYQFFSLLDYLTNPERGSKYRFLLDYMKLSSGELFGDLVSNAAHQDGDAIANAIGRVVNRRQVDRENPAGAALPSERQVTKIYRYDYHRMLKDVRRVIWDRYLKGKSDAEAQKVFDALMHVERNWTKQALALFTIGEPDPKSPPNPSEKVLWQADITAVNQLFLNMFESRLNR